MTFKWQTCSESGKCYCVDCGGLLTSNDRRPRSLVMRLKHPDSHLYICRECGCRNLVSRQASRRVAPPVTVGPGAASAVGSAEHRRHEIEKRIERNQRACLKLKAMIDSDRRLLKSLAERKQ